LKVTEFEHGLTLAAPAEGYVRSPGLHMSEIYGSLFKERDPEKFDKRDKDGNPLPFDLAKMEMGLRFEEMLEIALRKTLLGRRPGEYFTEHAADCVHRRRKLKEGLVCPCGGGIAYSPDYLFLIDDEVILGEFKLTWYSSKGAPEIEKFDKWIVQIKSYLYHLELRIARLYVFFVNGKYPKGGPPTPELRAWKLEFKQRELESNWAMMVRHANKKGMLSAGYVAGKH
jgi:hypothetical protein